MSASDPRPAVWVGHITLSTHRLDASHAFMLELGMRPIAKGDDFAVLELRAGTHLVLLRQDEITPAPAAFDLMVEDIDATHADLTARGIEPSEIQAGDIHRSFVVQDPSGHTITFNSSHVSDLPV